MTEIVLHGELANEFGGPFNFHVESPSEAIRALCSQLKGFENHLREGLYRIRKGDIETGFDQTLPMMAIGLGRTKQLHIIPELSGGKKGVGKVLLGIALIGATLIIPGMQTVGIGLMKGLAQTAFSVFGTGVTFGHIAMFGASLALGGVAMMMTPTPEVGNYGDREEQSSFMFNGPENRAEQGTVIPVVYGDDVWAGSVVVHTSIVIEDIAIGSGTYGGGGGYSSGPGGGSQVGGGTLLQDIDRYLR